MKRGPAAALMIAAGLLLLVACQSDVRASVFEREVARIEAVLRKPGGAPFLERADKMSELLQVTQTWRVRNVANWPEYAASIETEMAPAYSCSRSADSLVCTRRLPGDVFRLWIEAEPDPEPLSLRAELSGGPD